MPDLFELPLKIICTIAKDASLALIIAKRSDN